MKSPSLYFKTLENTWFHKYIFGSYYNRVGEKFKLNDEDLPNDIINEYKRLYQSKNDSEIQIFVSAFTKTHTFTSFYHHYWMGNVCDFYGVPFFMKTKPSYFYAKTYQEKYAKDKELFEKDMEKHRENKKKKHLEKKNQTNLKNKQVESKSKRRTMPKANQTKRYDDTNAVYINDVPIRTPSKTTKRADKRPTLTRKPKIFDDRHAVYVDDIPQPEPLKKPIMFNDKNAVYIDDPSIANQSKKVKQTRNKIKTLMNKRLRKKKKNNIKKELRRLKLEMLSLS